MKFDEAVASAVRIVMVNVVLGVSCRTATLSRRSTKDCIVFSALLK